jgi:hypothetical protein
VQYNIALLKKLFALTNSDQLVCTGVIANTSLGYNEAHKISNVWLHLVQNEIKPKQWKHS